MPLERAGLRNRTMSETIGVLPLPLQESSSLVSSVDLSWGRTFRGNQLVEKLHWADSASLLIEKAPRTVLPHGLGRSYGDSCLNEGGTLLKTTGCDRFIAFDETTGVLTCEAGISFEEILRWSVPRGWFLPVVPGTQFVTLGGALANDIHGKNHHVAGTFGRHVLSFSLLRSDGKRSFCSPSENAELFRATIGGLGLTGFVESITVQLKSIRSGFISAEQIPFHSVQQFVELAQESETTDEYTVAWVDVVASKPGRVRGIFIRGSHAPEIPKRRSAQHKKSLSIPFDFPNWILNPTSIRAFNTLYFQRGALKKGRKLVSSEKFFFPLDSVSGWNRIYGKRGLHQYQFVIPFSEVVVLSDILQEIHKSALGSFLAVLKTFGDLPSPGLLSFPRPGFTLALDFPSYGERLSELFQVLTEKVLEAGGRVYPAKDSSLTSEAFQKMYPEWESFQGFRDPKFSSSFWRRVTRS